MALVLPFVLHNQVCLFFIIVVSPVVIYISGYHVWTHVRNYRNPVIQRYCIRITLLVPVFLIVALISLFIPEKALWVPDLFKAGYEAFALYSFMALMLAFVGGPTTLVDLWETEDRYLQGEWIHGTCIHGTKKLDGLFLKRLVQGVIQFVIVRLLIVVTVPILISYEVYSEGSANFKTGWIYVIFIHNVSLWICLYSLWLFFLSTKHYLRPFSPVLKFALIKGIIFISFWQKIVLQILIASEVVHTPPAYTKRDIMDGWNNFLVVVECLPLAAMNFVAFSARSCQYDPEWGSYRMLMEHGKLEKPNAFPVYGGQEKDEDFSRPKPLAAFSHAVNAQDVFHHAYTTFSEHYGKYNYMALELSQREVASQQTTPLGSLERKPNRQRQTKYGSLS